MTTLPKPARPSGRRLSLVQPSTVPVEEYRPQAPVDIREVRVYVDQMSGVGYNSRWFVRHLISWWLHLLPRFLPKRLVRWVFGNTSRHIHEIVEYRKGWRALHEIYNYDRPRTEAQQLPEMLRLPKEEHTWNALMASFWETVVVCGTGTRNRFRQVKRLAKLQFAVTNPHRPFRILSIGCGSGQAILESIWEERRLNPDRQFCLTALDMDLKALAALRRLAASLNIPTEMVDTQRANITRVDVLEKRMGLGEFDLIEVVGFSEYQATPWLIELARFLHDRLSPGGALLFNNMRHTREQWFTLTIMDWALDLKDPEVLAEIMVDAGFNPRQVEVIGEPTETFWMAKAVRESL